MLRETLETLFALYIAFWLKAVTYFNSFAEVLTSLFFSLTLPPADEQSAIYFKLCI